MKLAILILLALSVSEGLKGKLWQLGRPKIEPAISLGVTAARERKLQYKTETKEFNKWEEQLRHNMTDNAAEKLKLRKLANMTKAAFMAHECAGSLPDQVGATSAWEVPEITMP